MSVHRGAQPSLRDGRRARFASEDSGSGLVGTPPGMILSLTRRYLWLVALSGVASLAVGIAVGAGS